MHDHGDMQVPERLEQLSPVVVALRRVGDEVPHVARVRMILLRRCTQLLHDLLHLCLVPPVQDDIEAPRKQLSRGGLAYPVCRSCHDSVWGPSMQITFDRARAEEVQPDKVTDAAEMWDREDNTE